MKSKLFGIGAIIITMVAAIAFAGINCGGGGGDSAHIPNINLNLDPEGLGYFEYRGTAYSSAITAKVIPGEYLYYFETSGQGITDAKTGWVLSSVTKARSEHLISDDMTVSRSDIVIGTADIVILTLNPMPLIQNFNVLYGQGHFEYRGIKYYVPVTVQVFPGEWLIYHRGIGFGGNACSPGWGSTYPKCQRLVTSDLTIILTGEANSLPVSGPPNDGIYISTAPTITLSLNPEGCGFFNYRGIKTNATPFSEVAGLYLYYCETSGKTITGVNPGWILASDTWVRSENPITADSSISPAKILLLRLHPILRVMAYIYQLYQLPQLLPCLSILRGAAILIIWELGLMQLPFPK